LKSALAALPFSPLSDSIVSAPLSSSDFSFQLSTFNFSSGPLISAFNFQLSAFLQGLLFQLSTFSFQLSAFNFQLFFSAALAPMLAIGNPMTNGNAKTYGISCLKFLNAASGGCPRTHVKRSRPTVTKPS
jgi:hypothetical protein